MIGFLLRLYLYKIITWSGEKQTPNSKYLLRLIKGKSKVQGKNISSERVLNFDQWKRFSENCKPMRVWLWLA